MRSNRPLESRADQIVAHSALQSTEGSPEFDTKSSFTPFHFNKIKHLQLIF